MPTLTIDDKQIEVENGTTLIQACEQAGVEIPRFCYHERLSIAGNCRMCLVELEKAPKPVASCAMPAGEGMVVKTNSPMVKKAREGVMEFLLINHPLDCPICDQGGECDLQDQAYAYGAGESRFTENKRAVEDKDMGPLVKTHMTRCIHCTRCVRFSQDVAGVEEVGAVFRGEHMEITTYLEKSLKSELSANVIDLCPVGALTSKPYAYKARPWELKKTETIDVLDAVGSNIRVDVRGREVLRVLPRVNEDVNEEWISDKTRYAIDGLKVQRLDKPYVRQNGKLQAASWDEAFNKIAQKLEDIDSNKLAGLVGGLQECESIYALRELLFSYGCQNLDSRTNGSILSNDNRGGYIFNSGIAGVEHTDACLFIGTNPKIEAPIINLRLLKAARNGAKFANVGVDADNVFNIDKLGNNASVLDEILSGKHKFSKVLKSAQRPSIIIGQGALNRADSGAILNTVQAIADKFGLITEDWNGYNMLHTNASAVGALDVGFVPQKKGKNTAQIIKAFESGDIDVLYLLNCDEVEINKPKGGFIIYQGHHGDKMASIADVILPGAAYTEKDGIYVNTEGRPQYAQKAVFAPGEAREDWKIIRALSERLGKTLPFNSLDELRAEMFDIAPHLEYAGAISKTPWQAVEYKAGKLSSAKFKPTIDNFYMTDVISRASQTMAECSKNLNSEDKNQKEAA